MRLISSLAVAAVTLSANALATPIVISPDEASSKDTFIYSAIPSGLPFGNASYLGASVESSGIHTVLSLIQFDLSSLSLNGYQGASLSVYARSKTGTPFSSVASDPSPTAAVVVDVLRVISSWDEATTTWSTTPTALAGGVASFTVNDVGQYYSVDLSGIVSSWIADPSTNFGIMLQQRSIVPVAGAPDAAAVFQSSGAANRPTLTINVVPEPMTLAGIGFVSMLAGRRRR